MAEPTVVELENAVSKRDHGAAIARILNDPNAPPGLVNEPLYGVPAAMGQSVVFHATLGGRARRGTHQFDAMLRLFKTKGADFSSAITSAIQRRDLDTIKALVAADCFDVNTGVLQSGRLALSEAIRNAVLPIPLQSGARTMFDFLLERVYVDAVDEESNETALEFILREYDERQADLHNNLIIALTKAQADVNRAGKGGDTPLHIAARRGRDDVVNHLIYHGANTSSTTNDDGETPLTVAASEKVRKVLLNALPPAASLDGPATVGSYYPLKEYITEMIRDQGYFSRVSRAYNVSLDSDFSSSTGDDASNFGILFRYGPQRIVSISGEGVVSSIQAKAPICVGGGKVIYTKRVGTRSLVYLNNFDLRTETETMLCHALSGEYEKNWGVFDFEQGDTSSTGLVVYSVLPLRILRFTSDARSRRCEEARNVRRDYPNLTSISRLWVDADDDRGTSIFRGGSRGIPFVADPASGGTESLFVGHVTLHSDEDSGCFPDFRTQRTSPRRAYRRMYYMFFYTVALAEGEFFLSRISCCFQPPTSTAFTKIVFPVGIAERDGHVFVSYGADDRECLVTSYPVGTVRSMLLETEKWDENNYVFHAQHANSIVTDPGKWDGGDAGARLRSRLWLKGTVIPLSDGRFNPAIARIGPDSYLTTWRRFVGDATKEGDVRNWFGKNRVSMERAIVSMSPDGRDLTYSRDGDTEEIDVGVSTIGGEDPRIAVVNVGGRKCPLVFVNDKDGAGKRRMYLKSKDNVHQFCHDVSTDFEKNWGFFEHEEGYIHFVYQVTPLIVGRVHTGSCVQTDQEGGGCVVVDQNCTLEGCEMTPEDPQGTFPNLGNVFDMNGLQMRGGTPGLNISESEYLFVGHAVQASEDECFPSTITQRDVDKKGDEWHRDYPKLYTIFFYTIEAVEGKWRLKRLSCCSHLPGKRDNQTKIVFPSGLATARLRRPGGDYDSFVVTFGERDDSGSVCAVSREFVDFVLRPVEEWNTRNYVVDINYFSSIVALANRGN